MTRIAQLEGRDHFVVPVVMLTVGVHAGSNGPIMYEANDLQASVPLWNNRPVIVYHSELNGLGVSAADPEILSRQKIGVVFNAKFDGRRLMAEAWIDRERVAVVDDRVLQTLISNQKMEVSTGLFFALDEQAGALNVARNYQPDHLAVLPDKVGACSIADGCGLAVNESPQPLGLPSLT